MGELHRWQAWSGVALGAVCIVVGAVTSDLKVLLVGVGVIAVGLLVIPLSRRTDRRQEELNRRAFGDSEAH
jgi:hydrogenase-4 membrane subunit HyfE